MEIPIQNVYFLLCYAWDKLKEKDVVAVDPISSTKLVDLFARILIGGVNHLLKRGFDRGYVHHQEDTRRLRGKILFHAAIAQNKLTAGRLPCEFDELSYNVLHNQILKTTMSNLLNVEELDPEHARALHRLCHRLHEVDQIELNAQIFDRVHLHRNNQFYDFLLKVCELIYENLLPSQDQGRSKFRDFIQDDQMAHVFESFVRNFYKQEQSTYRVKREDIYWQWEELKVGAKSFLPKMQTDISLTSPAKKIVIDCKFTPEATRDRYESEKLRSEHLYQINAYLGNMHSEENQECEVMLLYPTTNRELNHSYQDPQNRRIQIRTINLNQDWQNIHKDLLALIG